jgi:hypothetical protein
MVISGSKLHDAEQVIFRKEAVDTKAITDMRINIMTIFMLEETSDVLSLSLCDDGWYSTGGVGQSFII